MLKGTKVSWTLSNGESGNGITISDQDNRNVLVAVFQISSEATGPINLPLKQVVWFDVMDLKEIP